MQNNKSIKRGKVFPIKCHLLSLTGLLSLACPLAVAMLIASKRVQSVDDDSRLSVRRDTTPSAIAAMDWDEDV